MKFVSSTALVNRYFLFLFATFSFSSALFAQSVNPSPKPLIIQIGKDTSLSFPKVSPGDYKIDYPEFHVLDTEVTNRHFKLFLQATGEEKDDTEIARIVARRRESTTFSTADIPYSVEDESAIWRSNMYPRELAEHPVTLVTLHDAEAFAKWVDAKYQNGLVRLPTWNEWMLTAYGSDRAYPWGNSWKANNLHTSHGQRRSYSGENHIPKRTEPVRARPEGRTPEGVFGMLGNACEYICAGDPTEKNYFNPGSRSMGGGFTDGLMLSDDDQTQGKHREDYWGYSHYAVQRQCDLGFRLVVVPTDKNKSMLRHPRLFAPNNKSWMIQSNNTADKP